MFRLVEYSDYPIIDHILDSIAQSIINFIVDCYLILSRNQILLEANYRAAYLLSLLKF